MKLFYNLTSMKIELVIWCGKPMVPLQLNRAKIIFLHTIPLFCHPHGLPQRQGWILNNCSLLKIKWDLLFCLYFLLLSGLVEYGNSTCNILQNSMKYVGAFSLECIIVCFFNGCITGFFPSFSYKNLLLKITIFNYLSI